MTIAMQPIYTQTASGSAAVITFNNIPQTFTDLKIVLSARTANANNQDYLALQFNNDGSALYSDTRLEGNGSSAFGTRDSGQTAMYFAFAAAGATSTANTYASSEVYIPNYTGANSKQFTVDYSNENNTAGITYIGLTSGLYRSSSAITSIKIMAGNGNYASASTFTLYGITKG